MATTDLGKWMITNGGEYNPNTTYEQLTMVLYQNSTYITLRTVTGIIPNNDKINYILMAQGFSANALGDVVAKDTYGVIGDVGGDVSAQNLVDYLTNEVVNNLLKKTSISTVHTNSDNTVPSSSLAYKMQQAITKNKEDIATANSNLVNLENSTVVMDYATAINITTLKTWTESSYAISSPPAGFTFSDIVSITAFAQDGYGDRWLRVMANQRANASGTLSLMGYCINTTGSIPIIIRIIFKK